MSIKNFISLLILLDPESEDTLLIRVTYTSKSAVFMFLMIKSSVREQDVYILF